MSFEENFPSLKGEAYNDDDKNNMTFHQDTIKEFCLDKQTVENAIEEEEKEFLALCKEHNLDTAFSLMGELRFMGIRKKLGINRESIQISDKERMQ